MRGTIDKLGAWVRRYMLIQHNLRILKSLAERKAVDYADRGIILVDSTDVEFEPTSMRAVAGLFANLGKGQKHEG